MIRWLRSRVSVRSFVTALPLFVLGVLFAMRVRPRTEIEAALLFEIQIVLLFPLVIGPIRARPQTRAGRLLRWSVLGGVLLLFTGKGSYDQGGWIGVVTGLTLMLAMYAGALLDTDADRALRRMGIRWFVGMVAVLGSGLVASWWFSASGVRNAWWAALCLFVLGVAELFLATPHASKTDAPHSNSVIARRERFAHRLRSRSKSPREHAHSDRA